MPQETDKKLHEDLTKEDFKKSESDPNRYWKSNGRGGYDEIDTDKDWYQKKGDSQWSQHN